MKLILHIGAPKTGSTAIQAALRLNKHMIADAGGYFHDADERALTTLYANPGKRFFLQERLRHGDQATAEAWSDGQWTWFENQIDKRRPKFAVVSSEHFVNARFFDQMLERFQKRFSEVVAIGYVRDPVDLYPSGVDQRIRGGAPLSRLPTPEDFPFVIDRKLKRMRSLLGAENLTVRNFARSNLKDGDIIADFMDVFARQAGISLEGAETPPRLNDSLCAAAALWLLSVNEQIDYLDPDVDQGVAAERFETIKRLRSAEELQEFPKLKLTHPLLISALRHMTHDVCETLNREFLQGQEPIPTEAQTGEPPTKDEQRAAMREWLHSHQDGEAMARIMKLAV